MSNFLFLKKNNEKLFNIISDAEHLFRDEYFEQSIVQARRFAENLCKDILQDKVSSEDTFDSMINKIKDNSFGNTRMKEFSEDLYFLKKHGNTSAHSSSTQKDGKIALECLERSYEIAVFYSNIKFGYNKKLDKTVFSEEVLMTGKSTAIKSKPKTLKNRYSNELEIARKVTKAKSVKISKSVKKSKPKIKKGNSIFKTILYFLVFIVLILLGHFFL